MSLEKRAHHKSKGKNLQHNTDRLVCSNRYQVPSLVILSCMQQYRTKILILGISYYIIYELTQLILYSAQLDIALPQYLVDLCYHT